METENIDPHLQNPTGSFRSPLAQKLLRNMLSIYFALAITLTLVQLGLELGNERDQLTDDISGIVETFRPVFEVALWNLDEKQIQSSLEGVLVSNLILSAELFNEAGELLLALPVETRHTSVLGMQKYRYEVAFVHEEGEVVYPVGRIVVMSDSSIVVERARYKLVVTIVGAIVKTLLLWLICYLCLSRWIARPLGKLTMLINSINPDTNSEVQIELDPELCSRPDELGNLAQRCEAMRNALARRNVELQQARDVLEQRVEERTAQLNKASAAKSEFLAHMSHELRTPMNGVIGMAELLTDTALDSTQRGYVETLESSGKALLSVINNILDFSKIEAGKLEIEMVDFDLLTLMDDCILMFKHSCLKSGLNLVVCVAPDIRTELRGDSNRLRQIMVNLIGNATKFTHQGNIIVTLSLDSADSQRQTIRFEVADTGIGMTEEEQQRLFQSFTQADRSTTRKYGGTGLGLVITRELIALMGGEINVVSKCGTGTEFWFSLEFDNAEKPCEQLEVRELLSGRKILIVEDNAAFMEFSLVNTRRWGMQVDSAKNAKEAQSLIQSGDFVYDVILIDMVLPDQSGLDLSAWIHSHDGYATVPLLLVSAHTLIRTSQLKRYQDIGILGHLEKPVSSSELKRAISEILLHGQAEPATSLDDAEPETPTPDNFGHLRVLVAEDNKINQMVINGLLKKLEIFPDIAEDGEAALDAYTNAENPYDLVFMDCEMPVMDGWESTSRMRSISRNCQNGKAVTIIGLSAHAMNIEQEKALSLGMDAYLSKPVTLQDIRNQLTELGLNRA